MLQLMSDSSDLNATATSYLQEYCARECVRDFAVMLDGPWGSGKTYLIKQFLEDYPRHLYISLYGLSAVRQIDDEFYRQLHPVLSSKGMRIAGSLGKALLKGTLKFDFDGDDKEDGGINFSLPEIDLSANLKDPRERLLVFDDLERCAIPVPEVLGYINAFVEHDGLKVIIIANEKEVVRKGKDEYFIIKEKLVGQTLRINANVNDAYDAFLENIVDAGVRSFLTENREKVLGIHSQSDTHNLRILKQAMWDYERIARHFLPSHWKNEHAMISLMSVAVAISIEHRRGSISSPSDVERLLGADDLRALRRQASPEEDETIEERIAARYPQVHFEEAALSGALLADAILNGRSNAAEVAQALSQSKEFALPGRLPLWRRAWDYFDLSDDQADGLAREFMEAFAQRVFSVRGEVFHAFGIYLRYAKLGLVQGGSDHVLAECKAYVDDLVSSNRIVLEWGAPSLYDVWWTYENHKFLEKDAKEFREAAGYYDDEVNKLLELQYPEIVRGLLCKLSEGSDDFLFDLCPNNVRPSPYRDIPVLASIEPSEFVKQFFDLPPSMQRQATEALKLRYERGSLANTLAQELPWLEGVVRELEGRREDAGPVTSERIGYMLTKHLRPALQNARLYDRNDE
jgi:hypothetical protein